MVWACVFGTGFLAALILAVWLYVGWGDCDEELTEAQADYRSEAKRVAELQKRAEAAEEALAEIIESHRKMEVRAIAAETKVAVYAGRLTDIKNRAELES